VGRVIEYKTSYVLDLTETIYKYLLAVFYCIFISFLSVLLCWEAIKERKTSSLPELSNHAKLRPVLLLFISALLILDLSYGLWVLVRAHSSLSAQRRPRSSARSGRVTIGTLWPFAVSVIEIFIFRLLWTHYEPHGTVGVPFSINPLVDLDDLAIVVLIVSWLTWTKRHAVTWVAKAAGASLAPVVEVTVEGALLLADGTSIPFSEPEKWPRKGLGRSRIASVVSGRCR